MATFELRKYKNPGSKNIFNKHCDVHRVKTAPYEARMLDYHAAYLCQPCAKEWEQIWRELTGEEE